MRVTKSPGRGGAPRSGWMWVLFAVLAASAFAQPELSTFHLHPSLLEFEALEHGPCPDSRTISITCPSQQASCLQFVDDARWLDENPDNKGELVVSVNSTDIAPGFYETDIVISSQEEIVLGTAHVSYTVIRTDAGNIEGIVHMIGESDVCRDAIIVVYRNGVCRLTAVSGADGQFALRGLPPGKYVLRATWPGFICRDVVVEVVPGGTSTCDLLLVPDTIGDNKAVSGRLD